MRPDPGGLLLRQADRPEILLEAKGIQPYLAEMSDGIHPRLPFNPGERARADDVKAVHGGEVLQSPRGLRTALDVVQEQQRPLLFRSERRMPVRDRPQNIVRSSSPEPLVERLLAEVDPQVLTVVPSAEHFHRVRLADASRTLQHKRRYAIQRHPSDQGRLDLPLHRVRP